MMKFGDLRNAKAIAKEKKQEKEVNIDEMLAEAKTLFESYFMTKNQSGLKKAADLFFKVLNVKRTRVEPYFYISSIFFIYEKKSEAIRYLKMAEEVEPSYPNLAKLRQLIYST
jgi:hypothetical protein